MEPTNEERREIAHKLREYECYGSPLWYHVAKAFGFSITMTARKFLDTVADLIEPEPERTCHPVWLLIEVAHGYNDRVLGCSECSGVWSCKFPDFPNYCEHCGAKVVKQ